LRKIDLRLEVEVGGVMLNLHGVRDRETSELLAEMRALYPKG
jgi:hypothetical protein